MSAVPEPGHQLASAISEDPGHAPGFSFATLECPSRVDGSIPSLVGVQPGDAAEVDHAASVEVGGLTA